MASLSVLADSFVPIITHKTPVVHKHWSSSSRFLQRIPKERLESASESTGTPLTRAPSPQYYTESHLNRDRELEAQFKTELKALREEYTEQEWVQSWNLHKKFRTQLDQTFVDETNALSLTTNRVIRGNIKNKFARLRHEITQTYKGNKREKTVKLDSESRCEEEQLREKYYRLSEELRKQEKSEFHLEIFDKILAPRPDINSTGKKSLTSNADRVETVAQEHRGELNSGSLVEQPVNSAASVKSRASRRSASSTNPRPDRGSTHSSIRLQETPLLTKKTITSTDPGAPAQSANSDPVPVKRNFWGKIIS